MNSSEQTPKRGPETIGQVMATLQAAAAPFQTPTGPDTLERETFVAACTEILRCALPHAPLAKIDQDLAAAEGNARAAIGAIMMAIEACADIEEEPLSAASRVFADRWDEAVRVAKDIEWMTSATQLRDRFGRRLGFSDRLRAFGFAEPVATLVEDVVLTMKAFDAVRRRREEQVAEAQETGVQRAIDIMAVRPG